MMRRLLLVFAGLAACLPAEKVITPRGEIAPMRTVPPAAPPAGVQAVPPETSGLVIIEGFVRTSTGAPVANAFVGATGADTSIPSCYARTNDDGSYLLRCAPGKYKVSATSDTLVATSAVVTAVGSPDRASADMIMADSGGFLFTGEVVSESLEPPLIVAFWTKEFGRAAFAAMATPEGQVKVLLPEDSYLLLAENAKLLAAAQFVRSGARFQQRIESSAYVASAPSPTVLAELKAAIVPVATVNASHLVPELHARDRRRVVLGLGEPVHGSAESLGARLAVTMAVARLEPVTVALEANWEDALDAATYVGGGVGDPHKIAAGMEFFMWRTKEFADALMAIRRHNQASPNKIYLAGIDMQDPYANWQSIKSCSAGKRIAKLVDWLRDPKGQPAEQQLEAVVAGLRKLQPSRATGHIRTKRCSPPAVRHAVSAIIQSIRRRRERDWFSRTHARDAAMAENVTELAVGSDTTVALWAHNAHVSRRGTDGAIPLGQHLAKEPLVLYLPVGVVTDHGSFNARVPDHNNNLEAVSFPPAGPQNLASNLARLSNDAYLIDLRHRSSVATQWLSRPAQVWEAGGPFYGAENSLELRVPTESFDFLVFLPQITPSTIYGTEAL